MQEAIFAMGCFWSPDEIFSKTKGVTETKVGYTDCKIDQEINYKNVCNGETGCAEAIKITFDPQIITYKELIDIFWKAHDPTTQDRQGVDIGSQYRSAIYYKNEEQKEEALVSRAHHQKEVDGAIVTQILKATTFHEAKEYHQKYFDKNKKHVC